MCSVRFINHASPSSKQKTLKIKDRSCSVRFINRASPSSKQKTLKTTRIAHAVRASLIMHLNPADRKHKKNKKSTSGRFRTAAN